MSGIIRRHRSAAGSRWRKLNPGKQALLVLACLRKGETFAVSDPAASRAPDLVRRQFKASRPGELHVADFIYVPVGTSRFGYTAFVIDAFAGLIPGWECSLPRKTAFVEAAIRQAAAYRARQGYPFTGKEIHHSDAGSNIRVFISPRPSCLPGCNPL